MRCCSKKDAAPKKKYAPTRAQLRKRRQLQSVAGLVCLATLVYFGGSSVHWDSSPVFVPSARHQLEGSDPAREVDLERMQLAAFDERVQALAATLHEACTAHNLSTATHRNLVMLGKPVDESIAVTCDPPRALINLREVGNVPVEGYVMCKEYYGELQREKRRVHPIRVGWWQPPWDIEVTHTSASPDETCTFGHLLDVLQAAWGI